MNVVRCDYDGCENSRPVNLDDAGWLHVTQPQLWTSDPDGWDFCSYPCLRSWAAWRAERLADIGKGKGR